jgi:3-oxoacyl-[acyl-carrier protein] reductase
VNPGKPLAGRTAVVTGGTRGIGLAIARALAEDGASVVVSGRDAARLESAVSELEGLGAAAVGVTADQSKREDCDRLVDAAKERFGRIDVLVNNAGITRDQLLVRMKDEEWDQVIAVNLSAAFRLSRAVLRGMMKKRWGRIISITSIVGVTGNPGQANYAAAKAGLIGMTKSLAAEVASRNITVNTVAPGFIATAMTDALTSEQKTALLARVPAGRLGDSRDVAAAVAYLASDEAAYVTGQTLHVNGGMAML